MTAIAYETSALKKKTKASDLVPVLIERHASDSPHFPQLSRVARMALKSSVKADQHLTELYRSTIDEFKKKLYD